MLLDTARSPWAPDQAVRVARVVTWAAACAASGHMRAPEDTRPRVLDD